jgi:uncharacterized protein YkwD
MSARRLSTASLQVVIAATLACLCAGAGSASAHHYDHLLAPRQTCPGQTNMTLSAKQQRAAMRCMHDYARRKFGRARLAFNSDLFRSATGKSKDILRCDDFSHTACGRPADYWFRRVGYPGDCGGWWENIAWGSVLGNYGSVRTVMSRWLHSDVHRPNILRRSAKELGIGMARGSFHGYHDAEVWVVHFGYRC